MTTLTISMQETDPICRQALRLLRCALEEHGVTTEVSAQDAGLRLRVQPGIGVEGYRIEEEAGALQITGNDPRGLLYGVGRLLHDGSFGPDGFTPGAWRGASVPDCSLRGMYLAHNFHNWWRSASLEENVRYLEELALWGLNTIIVPPGTNPPSPPDDVYGTMIPKQVEMLKAARQLGIRVGMISSNCLDRAPEPEYAAVRVPDTDPERRGNIGHRVCMSHPKGYRAMREQLERALERYAGVGLDFVVAFPYDEGGCGCPDCWPWGAKGYLRFCRLYSELARSHYPGCRFIAGTWCFDVREASDGEFDGLDAALRADAGWCDYLMTDAHGAYPEWPLQHGAPGGLPMINFAEISMWGRFPWGGYGANPFPRRLVRIWGQSRHLLDGGLPYSEGRFEDINKVTTLRLFWEKAADADTIVRDYIHAAFGPAVVQEVAEAIRLLEDNYPKEALDAGRAERALALLQAAESRLDDQTRTGWRWRLLMLRAIIDVELVKSPDIVTAACNAAYEELIELYCAQTAQICVLPRAKSAYERGQLQEPPVFA